MRKTWPSFPHLLKWRENGRHERNLPPGNQMNENTNLIFCKPYDDTGLIFKKIDIYQEKFVFVYPTFVETYNYSF